MVSTDNALEVGKETVLRPHKTEPSDAVIGVDIAADNRAAVLLHDLTLKALDPRNPRFPPWVTGVRIGATPAPVDLDSVNIPGCSVCAVDGNLPEEASAPGARRSSIRLRNCSLTGGGLGARFRGQRDVELYNCVLENNADHGAMIRDVSHAAIIGCRFEANGGSSASSVQLVRGGGCETVLIDGCYLKAGARARVGVEVEPDGLTSIIGNMMTGHSRAHVRILADSVEEAGRHVFPPPTDQGDKRTITLNSFSSEREDYHPVEVSLADR